MKQLPFVGGLAIATVISGLVAQLAQAEEVKVTAPGVNDLEPASMSAPRRLLQWK